MKQILLILLAIITLSSCGNKPNTKVEPSTKSDQKDVVEVLYFHGKQRCITCKAIEKLTKEVLEENFAQQTKEGKVIFKVIDISTEEGEKIADKYEVSWSSLFINKWQGGQETKYNITDLGFSYAKNSPQIFKTEVEKKMNELLK